jgi:hypothetical protein
VRLPALYLSLQALIMLVRGLLFMDCSFPLLLLLQSSLDLHERRKDRLGPKRVVISAVVALALLIIAFSIWTSCYHGTAYNLQIRCPNRWTSLSVDPSVGYFYGTWYYPYSPVIDLSPYLPFTSILDVIL